MALQGNGIGFPTTSSMHICVLYSIALVPNGNEISCVERRINLSRRRGDAESTPESTHGGGRWQLGMPVQRDDLRMTRGRSQTSSRAMPPAFSRTKDGSRGCSLSRDSTIGTQENSRTQEFASIRIGGSCGLTGALAPWSERGYRSGRLRKALSDRPPHGSTALSCGGGRGVRKKRPPGVLHEGQIADSSGRSKVGLCPTWARRVLLHISTVGPDPIAVDVGAPKTACSALWQRRLQARKGRLRLSNLCVESAVRKSALFSCQIQLHKNERADFHFLRADSAP